MRKSILWQNTAMITVSFIAGVAFFQLFSLSQATEVIQLLDRRLLLESEPTLIQSIIPIAIFIGIVLLFATHPYFFGIAKVGIAIKTCFFGFSSVYLLAQKNELLAYGVWWFPFQFLYIVMLVVFCEYLVATHKATRKRERFSLKESGMLMLFMGVIFFLETVVISYVFK